MSWEPIDLAKLEPRPVSFPSIGGVNLIYPGKRHVFSGAPESAKTIAAYAIMLEEIRLGGNVLLIDFEMGPWDARERLSLLVNRSGDGTTAVPAVRECPLSSVGPGHDLAGRSLGWPCEQRYNVLPHPRPADLGLDPFLRLDIGECENEDRVGLIDLDEAGVEPTGLDDCPYGILRRFDHRRGNRLRKRQVIDRNTHAADRIRRLLRGGSSA